MANCLVIVESPAKVKTIKKFLGTNYEVDASNGHVRDLPKSQLGFDAEQGFEPKYITIRGKGDILAKLRKEVKKADKIYLATDPDREGEAISWHLMKALKLDEAKDKQVYRISFNEITKNAVKNSIKNPRDIDMDLVNAQQARRMLDRMVGYKISPLLWEKVKRGLSAGRVQSVALRMICDREDEINAFIPEEYWSLEADLKAEGGKKPLTAKFYGTKDGKCPISNKKELDTIKKGLEGQKYLVEEVKNGERTKKSVAPIYFIIAISSFLTEIPIVTVLLIRNTDTASRIAMIVTDTYPTSLFTLVSVLATISDLLTLRTPSRLIANSTTSFCLETSAMYTS